MDGAVGALAGALGLRKDALEPGAGRRVPIVDHQPLLAVAVGARMGAVAVPALEVVEEENRVLHILWASASMTSDPSYIVVLLCVLIGHARARPASFLSRTIPR